MWSSYTHQIILFWYLGVNLNLYHMLLVKLRNTIARKYPFLAQNGGSKWLFAPVMSEKHLKHIWNLILAGVYQFMEYVGISITSSETLLRGNTLFEPKIWVKMTICTCNVRKRPKHIWNLILAGWDQSVEYVQRNQCTLRHFAEFRYCGSSYLLTLISDDVLFRVQWFSAQLTGNFWKFEEKLKISTSPVRNASSYLWR